MVGTQVVVMKKRFNTFSRPSFKLQLKSEEIQCFALYVHCISAWLSLGVHRKASSTKQLIAYCALVLCCYHPYMLGSSSVLLFSELYESLAVDVV